MPRQCPWQVVLYHFSKACLLPTPYPMLSKPVPSPRVFLDFDVFMVALCLIELCCCCCFSPFTK